MNTVIQQLCLSLSLLTFPVVTPCKLKKSLMVSSGKAFGASILLPNISMGASETSSSDNNPLREREGGELVRSLNCESYL